MKFISDTEVENMLLTDSVAYMQFLKGRLEEIALGKSPVWVKPKIIYEDPVHPDAGDIRPMTCFTEHVKVVKVISTNPLRKKHWSVSVGVTLLLDYEENFPVAIFDAPAMSGIRTAAISLLVPDYANQKKSEVVVIGRGRVGEYIDKIANDNGWKVTLFDKDDFPEKIESNLVITATNSREAFITSENCNTDLLVSVGADTAFNHELTKEFLEARGDIYFDVPDAMKVGDLVYVDKAFIKSDLMGLISSGAAKTFISVGSPLMDALTVEYLIRYSEE